MIAKDKVLHFSICLLATLWPGWWFAASLALGKESWDELAKRNPAFRFWIVKGTGWGWGDLLADSIGILVGLGLRAII